MNLRDLFVRKGDPVLPAVNELSRVQRALRILPGRGILLTKTTRGVVVNARALAQGFVGAFPVTLAGREVQIGEGYVNGKMPEIESVPLIGNDTKPAPRLTLRADLFDKTGRSWVSLKVTVDETGRMIQPDSEGEGTLELTIVQRSDVLPTDPDDDTIGYHPLAMLRRPEKETTGLGTLHQIAMHDYQHRTAKQNEKWVHFFDVA